MSRVYTVQQLAANLDTAIQEIDETGEEVLVTRNGQFVVAIVPVNDAEIIKAALTTGPIAEELRRRAAADGPTYSTDEVLDMIHREPS